MAGTTFLVIAANWGNASGETAECVALSLFMSIIIFGNISGGHFNPAVTVSILIKEGNEKLERNLKSFGKIIGAQLAGGFLGCIISALAYKWEPAISSNKV